MPPTGGPAGVPGCCTCVAPTPTNVTVTVRNCANALEAGASVTVKSGAGVIVATSTTDVNGVATFGIPKAVYTLVTVTVKYTDTRSIDLTFFNTISVSVNHPACACVTWWPNLTTTDPWGALTLTTFTGTTTYWYGDHFVSCQGIGRLVQGVSCANQPITTISVLVKYTLDCLINTISNIRQVRLQVKIPSCGSSESESKIPVAGYLPDKSQDPNWPGGTFYDYTRISTIDLCSIDCRNNPDLQFTGVDFSTIGGSSGNTLPVTL